MDRSLAADSPLKHSSCEIDDDSQFESEIEKTLRASRLCGIAWHKHVHKCNKALGLSTSETPLSIVPESVLEDSDLGFLVESDASGGDDSTNVDSVGETAMGVEEDNVDSVGETAMGVEEDNVDSVGETAMGVEEDRELENMSPNTEAMMRILLPRYFDLVRSILYSPSVLIKKLVHISNCVYIDRVCSCESMWEVLVCAEMIRLCIHFGNLHP